MLAYEELKSARGREVWYRAPRYEANQIFPHLPPRLRVGAHAYQIHDISLGGVAAVAKQSPEDDLQIGKTIKLTIQQSGLPIFESEARVCRAEKTVFGAKVAFNFVDRFIEFDKLINRNVQAQIATRSAAFGTQEHGLVPQEYRVFCADVLRLLRSYRAMLDANRSIPPEFAGGFDHASAFEACEERFVQEWRSLWRTGNDIVRPLLADLDVRQATKEFTELVLTPELRGGAIWDRCYAKPFGYPGDFEMMNQVYDWERLGANAYEMLLHRVGLDVMECVQTRMERVRTQIADTVAEKPGDARARILSLGCGSAREVETYLADNHRGNPRAEFTLIDQEHRALDYAYRAAYPHIVNAGGRFKLQCLQMSFTDILRGAGGLGSLPSQDLIYCVGLIDYLTDRRAAGLVRRLYDQLAPGGLLIAGNMSDEPFSNIWPGEFLTDWTLYYRTEAEMLAWVSGLNPSKAWTETETTGRIRLLFVRKP